MRDRNLHGTLIRSALLALCACSVFAADTMTYTDVSGSSRTNEPIQFGRIFLQGEIANYPQVLVNGTPVTTQANVQSRWSDGTVKHAVISFLLASVAGSGSATFTFQNQATCQCGSGSHLSKATMLGGGYDFDATVTVGATTISARTILNAWSGTDNGTSVLPAYWNDGAIATTIILGDLSSAAAYDITVGGHPSLRPIFIATFWPTINKVKVRFVLENSNTLQLQDITYNAVLKTGNASPATVYTSTTTWASGIPHIAATRWTKVFWIGGTPDDRYNLDHNLAYMASTAAVPNYDTAKTVSGTVVASDYSCWNGGPDIYVTHSANSCTWDSTMGDTGGRVDIGAFPTWHVRWFYSGGDYRERQIMLGNADLASAWPIQIREGEAGRFFDIAGTVPALGLVLSIAARPTVDFSQGYNQPSASPGDIITPVGTVTSATSGDWSWDSAHIPDPFFVPYITTGDYFYLEQLRFWTSFSAAYPVASTGVNYGRGASLKCGVIYQGQVRAEAWGFRDRAEAAWSEPDSTPEGTLFGQWMACMIGIFDGMHSLTASPYNGNADWNWGRTVRATNPNETYNTSGGVGTGTYTTIPGHAAHFWVWGGGSDPGGPPSTGSFCQSGYGITPAVCESAQSGFELAYLSYGLGRAYDLGFPTDNLISSVVGPWYVAELTDAGYNPYLLGSGRIPVVKWPASNPQGVAYSWGAVPFTSMADLKTGYYSTVAACQAVDPACTIGQDVSSFQLSDPQNGYDILGSAATAMISPLTTGGVSAWAFTLANIESVYDYANTPVWAMLPRSYTPPTPAASAALLGKGSIAGKAVIK